MSAPLVKYQAYELTQLEGRSLLTFPAPGVTVYLAAEVAALIAYYENELTALRLHLEYEAQAHSEAKDEIEFLNSKHNVLGYGCKSQT